MKKNKNKKAKKIVNNLTELEMKNLSSELIKDVSYSCGDLYVSMRNGAKYLYPKVESSVVLEFLSSESFGKYFNENIRHRDFERLDE